MTMKNYLCLIDTQTSGPRCDVTPLFADPEAFAELVSDLCAPFDAADIDYVAGIDALGFILGTAIAVRLHKGFITIRKGGKLPVAVTSVAFVDYSGQPKALELRWGALPAGARVLLVDEWLETGAQVQAAVALIEAEGGAVAGIAAINMDDNPGVRGLKERYQCVAVWEGMEGSRTEAAAI